MIPNPKPQLESVDQVLRVTRLVVFAMVFGLFALGVLAVFMPMPAPAPAPAPGPGVGGGGGSNHILLTVAPAFAAVMLPIGFLIPVLITRSYAKSAPETPPPSDLAIAHKFPQVVIVRCAVWEGAALLNGVTVFLTGVQWPLGILALFAACMIATLPTRGLLEKFIRDVRGGEARFPSA